MPYVTLPPITVTFHVSEIELAALEAKIACMNAEHGGEWTLEDEVSIAFSDHIYNLAKNLQSHGAQVQVNSAEEEEAMRSLRAAKNLPAWLSSLVDTQ